MQVDGGSNCNMLADHAALALSEITLGSGASGVIGGIAGGLAYDGIAVSSASLGDDDLTLALLRTPRGERNLLSETVLLDEYGISALKAHPPRLVAADGRTVAPLERRNGLWYADVIFRAHGAPAASGGSARAPQPVAHAAVRADDDALLWAARLDTDADGLLKLSRATHGVGIERLSPSQREAVGSNLHRAVAQARHAPVSATPLADRATQPAETLVCDGFGKHHAASPLDGAVYQFSAVDEYSSFGYIGSGSTHTIDDWLVFLRGVVLDARAHGHSPKRVRPYQVDCSG